MLLQITLWSPLITLADAICSSAWAMEGLMWSWLHFPLLPCLFALHNTIGLWGCGCRFYSSGEARREVGCLVPKITHPRFSENRNQELKPSKGLSLWARLSLPQFHVLDLLKMPFNFHQGIFFFFKENTNCYHYDSLIIELFPGGLSRTISDSCWPKKSFLHNKPGGWE